MFSDDEPAIAFVGKDPSDETIVEADKELNPEPEPGHVDQPIEADAPPAERRESFRQPIIKNEPSKARSVGANSVTTAPYASSVNPADVRKHDRDSPGRDRKRSRQEASGGVSYEFVEYSIRNSAGKWIKYWLPKSPADEIVYKVKSHAKAFDVKGSHSMVIGKSERGHVGIVVSRNNACAADYHSRCARNNCKYYHGRQPGDLVTCLPGVKHGIALGRAGEQTRQHRLYKEAMQNAHWDKAKHGSNGQRTTERPQSSSSGSSRSFSQLSGRSRSRDSGCNINQGKSTRGQGTCTNDELFSRTEPTESGMES